MADDSFLLVPVDLLFLYGLLFLVAGVFLLTIIRNLEAGRQQLRLRRWWRQGAAAPKSGAERQKCGPLRSCSSCNRSSKADQELQQLVLPAVPKHAASPGADFWEAAWRDLAKLVEQGSLSCCSSPSAQSTTTKNDGDSLTAHTGAPRRMVPTYTPQSLRSGRVCEELGMHVAQRSIKVHLGTLSTQQQAARRLQCRPVLLKLTQPGQSQPLLQHRMNPCLQGKGDRAADSLLSKERLRQRGDANTTKMSQNVLAPGPAQLLIPQDVELSREFNKWGSQVLGQDTPATDKSCAGVTGMPPRKKICVGILKAPGATTTEIQGSKADTGASDCPSIQPSVRRKTDPRKLQLTQDNHRKLSMHVARKCLEAKLQRFPRAVRRSTEQLQCPWPPRRVDLFIIYRKHRLQPAQITQQQLGAPSTCPAACRAPGFSSVPVYFPSREATFLPVEEREALELHIRSMKLLRLGQQLI